MFGRSSDLSKHLQAVLLLLLLIEAAIFNGGSDAGEILNIFTHSVAEIAEEGE